MDIDDAFRIFSASVVGMIVCFFWKWWRIETTPESEPTPSEPPCRPIPLLNIRMINLNTLMGYAVIDRRSDHDVKKWISICADDLMRDGVVKTMERCNVLEYMKQADLLVQLCEALPPAIKVCGSSSSRALLVEKEGTYPLGILFHRHAWENNDSVMDGLVRINGLKLETYLRDHISQFGILSLVQVHGSLSG